MGTVNAWCPFMPYISILDFCKTVGLETKRDKEMFDTPGALAYYGRGRGAVIL